MAVGAPYVAFRDFGLNGVPRACVRQQIADLNSLEERVAVIKVEHYRIGFAAVAAGVLQKIFDEPPHIFGSVERVMAFCSCDVGRLVAAVVLAVPGVLALSAERVETACRSIFEVESSRWFELAAAAAEFLTLPLGHVTV